MWEIEPAAVRWREEKVRPGANEATQKFQQRNATEYEVNMRAFNATPFGHRYRHQFLIQLWMLMWPDFFIFQVGDFVNHWCLRMAKAFCSEKRLSMVGCASSGKSFTAAMYAYTLWKAKPQKTSIYLSTTTGEAGEARMWGIVKDLFARDKFRIGKRIDSLQLICLDEEVKDDEGVKQRDFRDVIRCVKIKTGNEGQNVVGTICGRKNDNVLWIADELNFMDIGVLDARVNLFSNDWAQFIGIGNAPTEGSPLYLDAEPFGDEFPDGWRSADKDVHQEWPTKVGKCLYFNGEFSPNFQFEKGVKGFPKIMNDEKREEVWVTSGREENNIYWSQFHGFPATVEISNKVITHALLKEGGAFGKAEWFGSATKTIAGMDCGFRAGGDPTVIDFAVVGKSADESTIISFQEQDGISLLPSQKSDDSFEVQMAKKALDVMAKKDCHDLAIDISGDGGMTAVALQNEARARNYRLNLVPISSMGEPDDRVTVPGEKRKASEMFDRKVSQLWTTFRILVQNKLVRGVTKTCNATQQMCARKFGEDEKKRFSVEKKKDMKKRTKRSPDHADARIYCTFMALSHGLSVAPSKAKQPVVFNRPENRPADAPKQYSTHDVKKRYTGWT